MPVPSVTVNMHSPTTWRPPVFYRVFFPALGLYFLFATVAYFDGGADLQFTALGLVLGLVLTVGPFRPVVRLGEQDVYARGVVFARRMPLRDIVEVEGGYDGLAFVTLDGRRFDATGVGEKFNITRWLGRRGKADSIADTIREARARVLAEVPEGQRESLTTWSPPAPLPLPAYVKVGQFVGVAVFLLGAYLAFVSDTLVGAGRPVMVAGTLVPVLLMLWAQKRGRAGADSD